MCVLVFINAHLPIDGIEWLNLPFYACEVTAGLRLEAISNNNCSLAIVVMLHR